MDLRIIKENETGIMYGDRFAGILLIPQNDEEERILQNILKEDRPRT